MARSTLVSVDLDDVSCYHAIHGLGSPIRAEQAVVLERCLPRFIELFETLSIKATFFVIGRDLARDLREGGRGAAILRQALALGHELANHSYAHAYDLSAWSSSAMARDVQDCDALLRELGADVRGFRAPGYTHNRRLLRTLERMGYTYDSSLLPSPLYFAAKIGAITALAVRGRRSVSMVRGGRSFLGPREPFSRADANLWELPVGVMGRLRWPMIGTALLSGPPWLRRMLTAGAERIPYAHFEFHGLDLACPDTDGYAAELRARQPELSTSLACKRTRMRDILRRRGTSVTLAQFADAARSHRSW